MKRSLIVAVSRNGVIGNEGSLPWRLSADLQRFKRLTMGHAILMGRKTYESIGRPLPGRTSIVLSRNPAYRPNGVLVASDLATAFDLAVDDEEAFVIGGAHLYREALPQVERIYLTTVDAQVEGDTTFPDFDRSRWTAVKRESFPADERNEYRQTFEILDRLPAGSSP